MRNIKDIGELLAVFVPALAFLLLPFFMRDTGSAMRFLLIVFPLMCLLMGIRQGIRHGVQALYPIAVGIFFVLSVPIYYNSSALIYAGVYAALSGGGMALGAWLRAKRG